MPALNYHHRNCGCSFCCQVELQDERAEELAQPLYCSGAVLSEALGELTVDQLAAMAQCMYAGDANGLFDIMLRAQDGYIKETIERRADDVNCSRFEAVEFWLTAYEATPAPVTRSWSAAA